MENMMTGTTASVMTVIVIYYKITNMSRTQHPVFITADYNTVAFLFLGNLFVS